MPESRSEIRRRLACGCALTIATVSSVDNPSTTRCSTPLRPLASARSTETSVSPIVSAELPPHGEGAGERFEGVLPPVSLAPCFSIRKPAARIYTLPDYVSDGILNLEAAGLLRRAVVERRNILGRERLRDLEVIVKAIVDRRTKSDLGIGPQPADRGRENVRRRVTKDVERARIAVGEHLEASARSQRRQHRR